MGKKCFALCFSAVLLFSAESARVSAQRQVQVEKLLQAYGEVDPREPYAKWARAVFERLRTVADRKPQLPPSLVLLNMESEIDAFAGEDGTILVTAGVLDICYRDRSREEGDNLLALVLAHELSHLSNEDFREALAFAEAKGSWNVMADAARQRELEADRQGVVYMWMAGFDPPALVRDESLLKDWVGRFAPFGMARQESHPSGSQRVASLREQVERVIDDLDYFSVANRLYEIGKYESAVEYYKYFARLFPSSTALNNIGLCHLQLAVEKLAACDKNSAMRFRAPGLLDPEILLRGTDRRGEGPRCTENAVFLRHKNLAREALEGAIEKDPNYIPARFNLASLLVLSGDGSAAVGASTELSKRAPSLETEVLLQLSYYMVGEENATYGAIKQTALMEFRGLQKKYPDSPLVSFNLAQMETNLGASQSAEKAWRNLLRVEPSGPYADFARNRLGISARPGPPRRTPDPPCSLGRISVQTRRWLEGLGGSEKAMTVAWRGTLYKGRGFSAFEVDRELVYVVEHNPLPSRLATLPSTPLRVVPTSRGAFHDYGGAGVELVGNTAEAIVYWRPTSGTRSGRVEGQ